MTLATWTPGRSNRGPEISIYERIRDLFNLADRKDYDAERAQATQRLATVVAFNLYMLPIVFGGNCCRFIQRCFG